MTRSIPRLALNIRFLKSLWFLAILALTVGATEAWPPDFLAIVKQKNRLTDEQLSVYLPFIYPPLRHPVTGALIGSEEDLNLSVPTELGNQVLASLGYVDVTAAPFKADLTGRVDCTKAIQAAVEFARDHQMACYFPKGTYLISDTIECLQRITVRDNGRISGGDAYPCILIGAGGPVRPRLHLAPRSPGFTDPAERKIVLHVVNCNTSLEIKPEKGPRFPQANISFNQLVCGLDIVIGEGNAGAVGMRMQAAEGSSIQDMTIDATHGHTGMQGAAGSGGSHHHITIIGGRIGLDTRGWPPQYSTNGSGTQPGPTMSRLTLIGQTETPAVIFSSGAFTAVGWHILRNTPGTAIVAQHTTWEYYVSQCSFIDCKIEFSEASPRNTVLEATKGVYLRNVYARQAAVIHSALSGDASGWTRVAEYAAPGMDVVYKGKKASYAIEQPLFIDGRKQKTPFLGSVDTQAPPTDLCIRHGWGSNFPTFTTPGVVNAKDYGAKGDGVSDDTMALQRAVDENALVFLPKGLYRLTDTLRLGAKTKIFGVHFALSQLVAYEPFGALGEKAPKPMVETPDDARAETALAFIGLTVMKSANRERAAAFDFRVPCYALRWRAGEDSVVRSPWLRRMFKGLSVAPTIPKGSETNLFWEYPLVRIEGQGGGKWFNVFKQGSHCDDRPGYRHLLISNTHNPLAFYHLHLQHSEAEAQGEIVDAQGVEIYGVKAECETGFLRVRHSSGVHVYGHSGWGSALPGLGLYTFEDCRDCLLSCFASYIKDSDGERSPWRRYTATPFDQWFPIVEVRQGLTNAPPPNERPVLYRIGEGKPW